jgi:hypothetical protein
MNPSTVSTAIAGALSAIAGAHVYDYVPDTYQVPAVLIYSPSGNMNQTFDGEAQAVFRLRLMGPSINAKGGQQALGALIDSVETTLGQNPSLTGAVQSTNLTRWEGLGTQTMPDGTRYYSVELLLDIYD